MEDSDDALRLEGTDWIIERYGDDIEKDAILQAGTGEVLGEVLELSEDELDEMRDRMSDESIETWFQVKFTNMPEYSAGFTSWECVYSYVLGLGRAHKRFGTAGHLDSQ